MQTKLPKCQYERTLPSLFHYWNKSVSSVPVLQRYSTVQLIKHVKIYFFPGSLYCRHLLKNFYIVMKPIKCSFRIKYRSFTQLIVTNYGFHIHFIWLTYLLTLWRITDNLLKLMSILFKNNSQLSSSFNRAI